MKKCIALLLILLTITAQSAAAVTLDFETDAVGAAPEGWCGDFGGTSYSKVIRQNENQYLGVYDADTGSKFVEYYFDRQEERFILEGDFMIDSAYPGSCIQFALRTWDDNSAVFVEFRSDSIVQVTQDDGEFVLASATPGEWMKCRFDIDIPAKYFNFYLNDTLTAERVPFRKKFADNISTLQLTSKNISVPTPRYLAMDNIKIEAVPREIALTVGESSAYVNGVENKIDESPAVVPYIEGERTMVPLRFISQAFGAKVYYDGKSNRAECLLGGKKISNVIGTNVFEVDGEAIEFDAVSQLVDDRTMVPIRVFAEAFSFETGYSDGEITITAP